MTTYVAFLRAVNVGGTGKLPMAELRALCDAAGFKQVQTYIASGNVVFASTQDEAEVKAILEAALERYSGKRAGVLVRTAAEMAALLDANPFSHAPPAKVIVLFLDRPPTPEDMATRHAGAEELKAGKREIYIHYPDGQGRSKLVVAAAKAGTGRNINTVKELARMATEAN